MFMKLLKLLALIKRILPGFRTKVVGGFLLSGVGLLASTTFSFVVGEFFIVFFGTPRLYVEKFFGQAEAAGWVLIVACLLYTSPSPRDLSTSRMPSSA